MGGSIEKFVWIGIEHPTWLSLGSQDFLDSQLFNYKGKKILLFHRTIAEVKTDRAGFFAYKRIQMQLHFSVQIVEQKN